MWRNFTKAVRELQRSYGEAFNSYRPDLHYMRGPGPKWHAKHGGRVTDTPALAMSSKASLRDMAGRRA